MTYQAYAALGLEVIAREFLNRQERSGTNLLETTFQQAQGVLQLVALSFPDSLVSGYFSVYGRRLSGELPLLWPAFLHELQQGL